MIEVRKKVSNFQNLKKLKSNIYNFCKYSKQAKKLRILYKQIA